MNIEFVILTVDNLEGDIFPLRSHSSVLVNKSIEILLPKNIKWQSGRRCVEESEKNEQVHDLKTNRRRQLAGRICIRCKNTLRPSTGSRATMPSFPSSHTALVFPWRRPP